MLMKMPYLHIRTARGNKFLPIRNRPILFGRDPENSLVLDDPLVKRFHGVIWGNSEGVHFHDFDPTNRTRLNGRPVHFALLRDKDELAIGRICIRLVIAPTAAADDVEQITEEDIVEEVTDDDIVETPEETQP